MDEKELKGITPEATPLTDEMMNPEMVEELSDGRGPEEDKEA